ncbi:MAG: phosphatidylglycerophosphatase A [Rickettsiales bacterium]|nr:phosphatidylglycerophosphatase A [Rickettsiales bacterium]
MLVYLAVLFTIGVSSPNFRFVELFVTFCGLGRSRLCPGTLASVATFPLWFLILSLVEYFGLRRPILIISIAIGGLFFLALRAVDIYVKQNNRDDDPREVVIDEVVGQLIGFFLSLFLVSIVGKLGLDLLQREYKYILFTFSFITPVILFRIYDIWKPGIVGKIDAGMKSALGIMLDDVVAGLFAGLTNLALFKIIWTYLP